MKKKFLIKILSIIFALGLINSSPALAKVEQNAQQQNIQQEKKLSKEEEKKQDIATINEVLKKEETLEEQMRKKVKEIFKNFKKEDYEVENYNLEVFKKDVSYFLIYTHKKTGAKVYFNLVLNKDKLKRKMNELIFRAPTKNKKGLIHFLEHCLNSPVLYYFLKDLQTDGCGINAKTCKDYITFVNKTEIFGLNEKLEKDYVKRLTKELNEPSAFEKGDKTFEVEKKRILNELKDLEIDFKKELDNTFDLELRDYTPGGEIPKVEKVTLKDVKSCYEKYIHPSNCLLIKNVAELNPQKIKNYLNLWHENYFKHYEKKEIKDNKYKIKNKDKFLRKTYSKNSSRFQIFDKEKNKKLNFKYIANLLFNIDKYNFKQKQPFLIDLEPFKNELEKLGRSLGYEKVFAGEAIILYGNKKELFEQKVLEENCKKIMQFIANKVKNLSEKDLFYCLFYDLKYINKFQIQKKDLKNANLESDPENYLKLPLTNQIIESFFKTGNPISEKFFSINKNNELESSTKTMNNYAKENLWVYDQMAKEGPQYINVFEKSDKTFKQMFKKELEIYEKPLRVLPVKLKDENSNKFVKDFAASLLCNFFSQELKSKQGLIYGGFIFLNEQENNFTCSFNLNKDSVKPLEDYFAKNFNQLMKKTNTIKEKDLKELKKRYKENFNSFKENRYKEFIKNEKKIIKDVEDFIKNGKSDENSVLYRKDETRIEDFFHLINNSIKTFLDGVTFTFFKDYKDYYNYFEKQMSFQEKYAKKFNEKATSEFAKEFLKIYLKPFYERTKKAYKLAEKKLKNLDSIKFKDVNALIKTAYLVEDKNEVEKVNKHAQEREKRIEKLMEKFKKS